VTQKSQVSTNPIRVGSCLDRDPHQHARREVFGQRLSRHLGFPGFDQFAFGVLDPIVTPAIPQTDPDVLPLAVAAGRHFT
jgi:hypothetical protein